MELTGKIETFDMDYFDRKEIICDIEGNYRVHLYHDKRIGRDVFDLYNGLNHGPIFSKVIQYGLREEYIHFLRGKVKVRFYVPVKGQCGLCNLHEMILPHDIGKKVVIRDLST